MLLEIGAALSLRVPILAAALVLNIGLDMLVRLIVVASGLTPTDRRPETVLRRATRGLLAALGVELVQYLVVVATYLFVWAVLAGIAVSVVRPAPSVATLLIPGYVVSLLLTPVVLGRWLCALPLIVERGSGPIAALRRSWAETQGNAWRSAIVYLAAMIPGLIAVLLGRIVPSAITMPLGWISTTTTSVLVAAFAVPVYRELTGTTEATAPQQLSDAPADAG